MPRFTDFLFAPWKIFGVLLLSYGGHKAIDGATDGRLCSIRDVGGGQMVSVCRVAGYEMPSFVFWASLLIFGIFLASSLWLLFQCSRLGVVLSLLSWKVGKAVPAGKQAAGKSISPQQLAVLHELMTREEVVAHAWRQFEDTLIVPVNGEEISATIPIEQALSRTHLVEENVSTALFASIPGILTGLGLLMTFVAILDGLSHVSVAANMDVKGIGGLINGLSGKFVSSIVAVTCAVSFVLVERIAYSRPDRAYRKLISQLSACFRRQTAEHLLYTIQTQLHSQAALQRELAQAMLQLQQQGSGKHSAAGESRSRGA